MLNLDETPNDKIAGLHEQNLLPSFYHSVTKTV